MSSRSAAREVAEVVIWGSRVGAVAWNPDKNMAAFEYDSQWLRTGLELSPFTLPLQPGVITFPEMSGSSFQSLPGLLADSLPGQFGLRVIKAWLRHHHDVTDLTPIGQLRFVGSSGPGALEFRPELPSTRAVHGVEVEQLADSARAIEDRGGTSTRLNEERLAELLDAADLTSDRHPKATIDWHQSASTTRQHRGGLSASPESWMITFARDSDAARVEYAYSLMAADTGIGMPMCRLFVDWRERAYFMRRRFDRLPDRKVHLQSLAALHHLDPDKTGVHSYEQALSTAQALGVGAVGVTQLYRRMVFNVIAHNQNDTTKKVAFSMNPAGEWRLAPAFDLTWSRTPTGQHQMKVNGKSGDLTRHDLREVGQRFGIRDHDEIIDTVTSVVAAWEDYASYTGIPREHRMEIAASHGIAS
jgi:serine/threonine-protein kinase HipA